MSTAFVRPLPFTVATASSPTPLAGSVNNLNLDVAGLVWRGALPTPYLIIDLGAGTLAYDTVAIIGTNLRATDTVQVRTGTTTPGTGGYAGTAVAAYTGPKADTATSKTIIKLGSTVTDRYIRIDFTATSHPDGFIQVQRLCVGKAITTLGISPDAEQGFEDRSVVTSGPGYSSVDQYDILVSWKISTGWISETSWRNDWNPFLQWAGISRAFLLILDDSAPANWQSDSVFGRITSKAGGKYEAYNQWRVEVTITALAA